MVGVCDVFVVGCQVFLSCVLVICAAFGVGVHVRDYCLMLLCGL